MPTDGIETDLGHKSFDALASDLAAAIDALLGKPEVALAVLGAIQSPETLQRIATASSGALGKVVLATRKIDHPEFPAAQIRTPLLLACTADDPAWRQECFGPISFLVRVTDTAAAIALSEGVVREQGALTAGVYSTSATVIAAMTEATWHAKVALSINLAGGVFVNQ